MATTDSLVPVLRNTLIGALFGVAYSTIGHFMKTEKVHVTGKLATYLRISKPEHFGNDSSLYKGFIQLELHAEEFGVEAFKKAIGYADSICFLAEEVQQQRIKEEFRAVSLNYYENCLLEMDKMYSLAIEQEADKITENKRRSEQAREAEREFKRKMRALEKEEVAASEEFGSEAEKRMKEVLTKKELLEKEKPQPKFLELKCDHILGAKQLIETRVISYVEYITDSVKTHVEEMNRENQGGIEGMISQGLKGEDQFHTSSKAYRELNNSSSTQQYADFADESDVEYVSSDSDDEDTSSSDSEFPEDDY